MGVMARTLVNEGAAHASADELLRSRSRSGSRWFGRARRTVRPERPGPELKTPDQIELMRLAGRVVRRALEAASRACVAGATTRQVNDVARTVILGAGGVGLFRDYPTYRPGEGFPGDVCVSVNEEIVHGIPGSRVLCDGDIVTVDCGVKLAGWCADAAVTVPVGDVSRPVEKLVRVTREVLAEAIEAIRPGRRWSQVARIMQELAESAGFGVVREFVGHGIGRVLHELPQAPAYVSRRFARGHDFELEVGMTLAVEPMLTLGNPVPVTLADGWTVVTRDRLPSCHVEHTIAVTPRGADVLTDGR